MEEDNKKIIYVKTKSKQSSIPRLGVALLIFILFSLAFYVFMKLLYLLFSGANVESKNKKVSNSLLPDILSNKLFVIIFVILLLLILVLIISKSSKNENKLLIEVDKNKGIKCKKCGCINDIETQSCCNCGFGSNITYLCPNCNVYNNISSTECIHCNEKINLVDVKKYIKKEINKKLMTFFIDLLLLIILLNIESFFIIILFFYVVKIISNLVPLYKSINTINEIIRNDSN